MVRVQWSTHRILLIYHHLMLAGPMLSLTYNDPLERAPRFSVPHYLSLS